MNNKEIAQGIAEFICRNGWTLSEVNRDSAGYSKLNNIGIDISLDHDEIVLVDDRGDFLHLDVNYMTKFTLIGYMIEKRLLDITYKS